MFGPKFPFAFIQSVLTFSQTHAYINFHSQLKTWNLKYDTTIKYQAFTHWILGMVECGYLKKFAKNTYRIMMSPLPAIEEEIAVVCH